MNTPPMIFQTQIGFGSVALPATAGQFIQLPQIAADLVGFARTSADIRLAGSASPGAAYLLLNTGPTGNSANSSPSLPCAGDCSNLWVANDSNTAQTISFMWLRKCAQATYQAC